MRIRHAATALVALGAAAACGLGSAVVSEQSNTQGSEPSLATASWSVQVSTDFGTTWDGPALTPGTTPIQLRVDTAALHARAAYQPLTLRTAVDSDRPGVVTLGAGTLVSGAPAVASGVRVRAVESPTGTCASTVFDRGNVNLLTAAPGEPAPLGASPSGRTMTLGPATATTPGAAETFCLEFTADPGAQTDGAVTLAWPVTIRPGEPSDG